MSVNNTQLPVSATTGDAVAVTDTNTTNGAGAKILIPQSQAAILAQSQNVPSVAGTGTSPAATLVVKASAGNLFSLYVMNRDAATRYIFISDATSAGATGLKGAPIAVPPSSEILIGTDFFTLSGWSFATGIAIGLSTSNTAYSVGTGSDHDIAASYI